MSKLQSLKERPATEKDLHKKIYDLDGVVWEMLDIREYRNAMDIDNGETMINVRLDAPNYFWQPVKLVSQEEYDCLKEGQIKGLCKDCSRYDDIDCLHFDKAVSPFDYCSEFQSEPTADKGGK